MFDSIALGLITTLNQLDPIVVIGVFTLLLLAMFAAALITTARGRTSAFALSTPTLLTTLGILGTFLGIAIGLLQFDVTQVEYSIPTLLEGLKLAFITSIVGIALSAVLRFVQVLSAGSAAGNNGTRAQPGQKDDRRQLELAEAQLAATQALNNGLKSFDQHLNQTMETHHQRLMKGMDNFAAQLSELGSRQLVAALEEVIRDFNDKLGVQFGENFRRLDGAVGKLLEWQDQYRQQMESLGSQLERATAGVAKSEASLKSLTQQALQISQHVADQQSTLSSLRRETMELEALLGAIAELRDKAQDAFPAMDKRLTAMLESIETAVLAAQHAGHAFIEPPPAHRPGRHNNPDFQGIPLGEKQ
ncbi:hypothetical protein [Thiorhodovibrio frisius]|uniref:MotA/TolQ/ExbB proton channel domain-containing protein n=1 Tax=Thiorhodovibrio frisius TaxID=631362 RepID=H8Z4B7_9GAMM|nr:hypothetical protein [Thiorhodovibrio frisius]EIC20174.1 hypothetical protein Thi970DRAFT_03796 [Thiorhodovibrio frisius]WPL20911.1 hypothetical protein Thiofri_01017 [Thiorhodovibrio frisius]